MLAATLLLAFQITRPPEFAESPGFRPAAPSGAEGSSHVSSQQEATSQRLLSLLARFRGAGAVFDAALTTLERRMLSAAAEQFRVAHEREASSRALVAGHAVCLFQLGKPDEAAGLLIAERDAWQDDRWIELAGEMAAASPLHRATVETKLRNDARGVAKLHLGRLVVMDDPAAAQKLWREAASAMPRDARPCLELGRTAKSDSDAIEWYEAALARQEDLADAHYRLALLHKRAGDERRSAAHMARFRALKPQ
jgi:hypothetical protein